MSIMAESITFLDVVILSGTASGYLVIRSIYVSMSIFFSQSMATVPLQARRKQIGTYKAKQTTPISVTTPHNYKYEVVLIDILE